jgi:hypothetical protein
MRLVMDHQEIPKLLTVLTDSPFPVSIWHVEHTSPYDYQKNRQAPGAATAAVENEADQKKVKEQETRLTMAMNQVNLAEVLVAGTFLLFDEPAAPSGQSAGGSPSGAPSTAAAPSGKGTPATKPAAGAPVAPTGAKPASSSTPGRGTSPVATPGSKPAGTKAPDTPSPKSAPASGAATPKAPTPGSTPGKISQPVKSRRSRPNLLTGP